MSVTDDDIERQVIALRAEIRRVYESGHVRLEDFRQVEEITTRLLPLERELARRRSLPFAVPIEWPSMWHKEDYGPEVRASSAMATIVHGVSDASHPLVTAGYAVIHIQLCSMISVLGAPEHAYTRHPLFGAGLRDSGVYGVENSTLLTLVGKLHTPDDDFFQSTHRKSHFLFAYENAFVDCVARSAQQVGVWPSLEEARTNAHRILFP